MRADKHEGANLIIGIDGEGGGEWEGKGGGQSCASVQAAREERDKERDEQDKTR